MFSISKKTTLMAQAKFLDKQTSKGKDNSFSWMQHVFLLSFLENGSKLTIKKCYRKTTSKTRWKTNWNDLCCPTTADVRYNKEMHIVIKRSLLFSIIKNRTQYLAICKHECQQGADIEELQIRRCGQGLIQPVDQLSNDHRLRLITNGTWYSSRNLQ